MRAFSSIFSGAWLSAILSKLTVFRSKKMTVSSLGGVEGGGVHVVDSGSAQCGPVSSTDEKGDREESVDRISEYLESIQRAQGHPDQTPNQTTEQLKQEIALRKEMEANLLTAMEVADETVAAKVEFLKNINHQLRTPMTTVISSIELLFKTQIDDEQKELLNILKASSASMMLLINNLLDMAKILAQELTLEATVFNLRENIENCLRAFVSDAEKKNIKLFYEIHPSAPDWLIGDDYRLLQILNNLVSNAIKFTEQGEVRLRVSSDFEENRGSGVISDQICLHFEVSDTGIGMSPDKVGRIFDSVYQTDSSMARYLSSTGLGLAITKKLIELMDGRIWVESEEGKGSTFHFVANLKLFEPAEKGSGLESSSDKRPSDENQSLRNRLLGDAVHSLSESRTRILLAEDNPEKQESISSMLRQHGYIVEVANNSADVLEALERSEFNVFLIDIHMPELDGRGILEIIRQNEEQSGGRVPIIALMAQSRIADREQCYRMQLDNYVGMPVQPEELYNVIENALHPSKTK